MGCGASKALAAPVAAPVAYRYIDTGAEAEAAYRYIDTDGSGTVNMKELITFLTRSIDGQPARFGASEVECLLKEIDANGDGVLSADEFKKAWPTLVGKGYFMANIPAPDGEEFEDLVSNWYPDLPKGRPVMMLAGQPFEPPLVLCPSGLGKGCKIPKTEKRAMRVVQLQSVVHHIKRRCEKETWLNYKMEPLAPEKVSLYECCAHVIKPATQKKRVSYVELVASEEQPPTWFCSHWWGEPVFDFVACVETHAADHGYTGPKNGNGQLRAHRMEKQQYNPKAGYWVCAYANNQWKLDEEIAESLDQTSFRKALGLSIGCLSILDSGGMCFKRVWCSFEMHLAFTQVEGLKYEVYTAHEHKLRYKDTRSAVGISDGPAIKGIVQIPKEGGGYGEYEPVGQPTEEGTQEKATRESYFPLSLAEAAFGVMLETADASVEADKVKILNTIAGQPDLAAPFPTTHENYESLNALLRGRFAVVALRLMLEQGVSIEKAAPLVKGCGLKKLNLGFKGCKGFNAEAMQLITTNLPPELEALDMEEKMLGPQHAVALAEGLKVLKGLTSLKINNQMIGDEGAKAMAEFLKVNSTLPVLNLSSNHIGPEGGNAMLEALKVNKTLTSLNLRDNGIGPEGGKAMAEALTISTALAELNLSSNSIGPEGGKAMLDALTVNKTLASLDLSENGIGPEGGKAMLEALTVNDTLTALNMGDNHIFLGDSGGQVMAETLKVVKTLTSLNVSGGGNLNSFAAEIAEALKLNTSLTWLDLNANKIEKKEKDVLEKAAKGRKGFAYERLRVWRPPVEPPPGMITETAYGGYEH